MLYGKESPMPMMPNCATTRSTMAALGIAAATALAPAQTVCGTWEPLVADLLGDIGIPRTRVQDLIVFDAGDGPMLYMAGNFEVVIDPVFGEVRAPGLARWDGQRWSAVPGLDGPGLELDRRATTLEVFDDGSGPVLFAGGEFTTAGGQAATGIARWDGAAWSGMGGPGFPGGSATIYDIHVHDFGGGPMLYACGVVARAGRTGAGTVWRYDGTTWTEPGDETPRGGPMYKLASYSGHLYAAGSFQLIGSGSLPGIARFDGAVWSTPLGPDQGIRSTRFWPLLRTDIDGRDVLVAGGVFTVDQGGETIATQLATWNGERWDSLTTSPAVDTRDPTTLTLFDDGSGPDLFVGGIDIAGGSNVARWRGGTLTPLPPLEIEVAVELFVYDDGAGQSLLAGGGLNGGIASPSFLARWTPDPPCIVDVTDDCRLDLFDYLAFQNLFEAGDLAADFDGDGSLTVFDFLAFKDAFDLGCP